MVIRKITHLRSDFTSRDLLQYRVNNMCSTLEVQYPPSAWTTNARSDSVRPRASHAATLPAAAVAAAVAVAAEDVVVVASVAPGAAADAFREAPAYAARFLPAPQTLPASPPLPAAVPEAAPSLPGGAAP